MNAPLRTAIPRQFAPTQFTGKTWIYAAPFAIFGAFSAQGLVAGPLLLTGVLKTADGRPGTQAGIALLIIGIILAPVTALFLFNTLARRRPLVYLCREGIVVNLIGVSTLEGPLAVLGFGRALAMLRVTWLIVSGQGFRRQLVYAPWQGFQAAQISGPAMQRRLAVWATFNRSAWSSAQPDWFSDRLWFDEAEFSLSLDQIARSITIYSMDAGAQQQLPSWHD
jgi:hypothetical protein